MVSSNSKSKILNLEQFSFVAVRSPIVSGYYCRRTNSHNLIKSKSKVFFNLLFLFLFLMNDYVPSVNWDESFNDPLKNDSTLPFGQLGTILENFTIARSSSLVEDGHIIAMVVQGVDRPSVNALYTKIGGAYRRISATAEPAIYPDLITLSVTNVAVINSLGLILINANPLVYPPIPGILFKSLAPLVHPAVDSASSTNTVFKLSSDEQLAKSMLKRMFLASVWTQTGKNPSVDSIMRRFFPGINLDGLLPNLDSPITADNVRAMVEMVPGDEKIRQRPPWNENPDKPMEAFTSKYMAMAITRNIIPGEKQFMSLKELFLNQPIDSREGILAASNNFFRTRAKMMANKDWLALSEAFYTTVLEFKLGVRIPIEFLVAVTTDMFQQMASLLRNTEFLKKVWSQQLEILTSNFQGFLLPAKTIEQAFTDYLIENPISPRVDVPNLSLAILQSDESNKKAKVITDEGKKGGPFSSVTFCLHHWLSSALDNEDYKCGSSKCKFKHETHYVTIAKSIMLEKVEAYLSTGSRSSLSLAQKTKALEYVESCYSTKIVGKDAKVLNTARVRNMDK